MVGSGIEETEDNDEQLPSSPGGPGGFLPSFQVCKWVCFHGSEAVTVIMMITVKDAIVAC